MKNKEIEELLNDLKDVAKRHTIEVREYGVVETIPSSISKEVILNSYSANLLLSYIEQLEEEIHKKEAMYDSLAVDYRLSQEQNEQLENNRDKAIEFIEEILSSTKGVINDYSYNKEHNKQLIELLNEDVEMYKHILDIVKGDSDE